MLYSRLVGARFLVGFLTYGAGSLLVASVVGHDDFLTTVQWTALTYLTTMIFEVALMAVWVLELLMLVPLADQAQAGQLGSGLTQSLGSLAVDINEMAYQIGQMSLGFGCLFLCYLLLRSGLVPPILAALGLVGCATHMLGGIFELFGIHISLILLIPGGTFEIALAIWLLVKGCKPQPYSHDS